jgi:hypothetical protein
MCNSFGFWPSSLVGLVKTIETYFLGSDHVKLPTTETSLKQPDAGSRRNVVTWRAFPFHICLHNGLGQQTPRAMFFPIQVGHFYTDYNSKKTPTSLSHLSNRPLIPRHASHHMRGFAMD